MRSRFLDTGFECVCVNPRFLLLWFLPCVFIRATVMIYLAFCPCSYIATGLHITLGPVFSIGMGNMKLNGSVAQSVTQL